MGVFMNIAITKENFKEITSIFDVMPNAMVVLQGAQVVYFNKVAAAMREHIEGEYIGNILASKIKIASERLYKIQYQNEQTIPTEYEIISNNGQIRFIEATAYPMSFMGESAVLVVATDITERKRDVLNTAMEQRKQFQVITVKARTILVDSLYQPALDIGGDFYFFHTLNDHEIIGVIGDVSGKGSLAAMLISSFEVLFHEAIVSKNTFADCVDFINDRLMQYFKDRYIATLFFKINTESVDFISCGINRFVTVDLKNAYVSHSIEGPFLGMFNSNIHLFESLHFSRKDLKQLILFTDGMENVTNNDDIRLVHNMGISSTELITKVNNRISNIKKELGSLKDDIAMVSIDLDFSGQLEKYVINSLAEIKSLCESITFGLKSRDVFNIKLIINELVTNAYKHGNAENSELPIGIKTIIVEDYFIIKVTDMAIKPKHLNIMKELDEASILSEHGRGLFILNSICQKIYFDNYNIIVEYKLGGKQ